jgi:Lysyl oxidase
VGPQSALSVATGVGERSSRGSSAVDRAAEPLLPDLRALRASDLSIERLHGGGRELRFEGTLANVGDGPLELITNRAHPCPAGERHASQLIYRDVDGNHHFKRSTDTQFKKKSAGCFLFHRDHNHWHFDAAARYRLFKPGVKGYIAQAKKVSFCLRDSVRVPAAMGDFHQGRYYGDCSLNRAEGITVGWADVYESFLYGQSLRLPPRVRNGVYCLSVKVDPKGLLYESDETDNISYRAFRINGARTIAPHANRVCQRHAPGRHG